MGEKYYQASDDKTLLQITTSKDGLIISVLARALSWNGKWSSITLNVEQREGLRKFLNETPHQINPLD